MAPHILRTLCSLIASCIMYNNTTVLYNNKANNIIMFALWNERKTLIVS